MTRSLVLLSSIVLLLSGCAGSPKNPGESDPELLKVYNSFVNKTFNIVNGSKTSKDVESFTISPSTSTDSWGTLVFNHNNNDRAVLIKKAQPITSCRTPKGSNELRCSVYDGYHRRPWFIMKRYEKDGFYESGALLNIYGDIPVKAGQVLLGLNTIGTDVFIGQ